ncbi:MAG TPA: hypothetical protein VJ798_09255 [Rhizomicrobium sp.]|nr:hypothetical protein [Rhizomicrobium sp.]
MFVRFVIKDLDSGSGRRQGLFQAAADLKDSGRLTGADQQQLESVWNWFKENLEKPTRLAVSARPHSKAQAISWYRDTATAHIARMREMQDVLERYGVTVQMIKAKRLGYILYEDEFQVAAYPFSDTPT